MPRATARHEVEITLMLNEEEACYLRDMLQNYLGGDPSEESDREIKMRESLFHSIKDSLEQ